MKNIYRGDEKTDAEIRRERFKNARTLRGRTKITEEVMIIKLIKEIQSEIRSMYREERTIQFLSAP